MEEPRTSDASVKGFSKVPWGDTSKFLGLDVLDLRPLEAREALVLRRLGRLDEFERAGKEVLLGFGVEVVIANPILPSSSSSSGVVDIPCLSRALRVVGGVERDRRAFRADSLLALLDLARESSEELESDVFILLKRAPASVNVWAENRISSTGATTPL
jgi:hypothetical protein